MNHVHEEPERVGRYVDLVQRERVWTLLNKKDDSTFATFEEFCRYEQPWGLGRPFDEIRPYLEAVHGKRGLDLMTAPPSKQGKRTDLGEETSATGLQKCSHETDRRLRAILRAPSYVQDLYRQGLVSQKVAAKLGPSRPKPEQAAAIAGAVEAVRMFTKPEKLVRDGIEQKVVRVAVDKRFKQLFDEPVDPVQRTVERVVKAMKAMNDEEKLRLGKMLVDSVISNSGFSLRS